MSWRGHMFGVSVDSDCELVGCDTTPTCLELPQLVLRAADSLPAPLEPLTFAAGGRPDICRAKDGGYVIRDFHISPGGESVRYVAGDSPPWRWQRYLIGRVLPLAATLLGREPIHASAVACGEGAVLLAGESLSGKSTLAAELIESGLRLMADDVAALDGELMVHPGPGLMSLRRPRALGEIVGGDDEGLWVSVEREPRALPVSALYLLEPARTTGISVLDAPDPGALLAASFVAVVREPARLARQLDVCAALAGARVARVGVPPGADFTALACALLADLRCEVPV
jgi:hypothetical protein